MDRCGLEIGFAYKPGQVKKNTTITSNATKKLKTAAAATANNK